MEKERMKELKFELIIMRTELREEMECKAAELIKTKAFEQFELESQLVNREVERINQIINLINRKYLV